MHNFSYYFGPALEVSRLGETRYLGVGAESVHVTSKLNLQAIIG